MLWSTVRCAWLGFECAQSAGLAVAVLPADGSAWGLLLLNSNAMDMVPSADKLR
jgi:hypothetical protein